LLWSFEKVGGFLRSGKKTFDKRVGTTGHKQIAPWLQDPEMYMRKNACVKEDLLQTV